MRVDSEGIREMGASELVFMLLREDHGSAPAGVYVQPEIVFFADSGDFGEGVVGAQNCSAGRGVDVEGCSAFGSSFEDELLEFRGYQAALRVNGNRPDVVGSETAHLGCFLKGVVAMS